MSTSDRLVSRMFEMITFMYTLSIYESSYIYISICTRIVGMITVLTKLLGIALQHLLESKVPAHFAMVYDTTSQTVFFYQYLVRLDHR